VAEWLSGRDTSSAGIGGRGRAGFGDGDEGRLAAGKEAGGDDSATDEGRGGICRRELFRNIEALGEEAAPVEVEEGHPEFEEGREGGDSAGTDEVELFAEGWVVGKVLGAAVDGGDPVEAQVGDAGIEEGDLLAGGLDQGDVEVGPHNLEGEAGEAGAAADVDQAAGSGVHELKGGVEGREEEDGVEEEAAVDLGGWVMAVRLVCSFQVRRRERYVSKRAA